MDTSTSRTPLTIIVVEDNPVDVYLIQWVLKAHELSHELRESSTMAITP
jgi:CheY-like chemotaxis protein